MIFKIILSLILSKSLNFFLGILRPILAFSTSTLADTSISLETTFLGSLIGAILGTK